MKINNHFKEDGISLQNAIEEILEIILKSESSVDILVR